MEQAVLGGEWIVGSGWWVVVVGRAAVEQTEALLCSVCESRNGGECSGAR